MNQVGCFGLIRCSLCYYPARLSRLHACCRCTRQGLRVLHTRQGLASSGEYTGECLCQLVLCASFSHTRICRSHASQAKVHKHSQSNHTQKFLASQPPAAKFATHLCQQEATQDLLTARAAAGATATTSQSLASIELNTIINTQVGICSFLRITPGKHRITSMKQPAKCTTANITSGCMACATSNTC